MSRKIKTKKAKNKKKRIVNNPWIVTIIGGIIVTLIFISGSNNVPNIYVENSTIEDSNIVVNSPNSINIAGDDNTININQPWDLTKEMINEIDKVLLEYNPSEVKIIYLSVDGDSGNFAYQLKEYIESKSIYIVGMYQHMPGDRGPVGLNVFPDSYGPGIEAFTFYVGRKN